MSDSAAGAELLRQASNLHRQGRLPEAAQLFEQALQSLPQAHESWNELAYVYLGLGRHEAALAAFGQAIAQGVKRPAEAHLQRAVLYADHLRRDDAAETELKTALSLDPVYVSALLNLGNLYEQRGDKTQALACYERLLAAPPPSSPQDAQLRWVALARSAIMRAPQNASDPIFEQLYAALQQVPNNPLVRANLLFALGHSHDRVGDCAAAFDAYAKANRCVLRYSGRAYHRGHAELLTQAFINAFPAVAKVSPEARPAGPSPLFICGMYRSGSTLVEQVLAAHSKVVAGGEVDWLLRLAAQRLQPFPASVARLTAADDAALAGEYREHLARLFPQADSDSYISDKRPDNFQLIGLIKRLFPHAKIVHTVRNPLDNGLSVYMQHLHLQVTGYASDLGDIGHYYGQYHRLMQHWKSLYPDDIFDFDYDAFIAEPQERLRALLQFLELDWDPRCLEFHTLRNTVKTASYWQVRRPLYADAAGRWRRYQSFLVPLIEALRAAGIPTEAG
jgi:tetratricopeptide (TPR) repeat protein